MYICILQAPPNNGSTYYNYKEQHSLVLLGISDAHNYFTVVELVAQEDNVIVQFFKIVSSVSDSTMNRFNYLWQNVL